jgi:hypothetical protein
MSYPFITGSRFKSAGDFVPFEYNAGSQAEDFIFSVDSISSSNFHIIGGKVDGGWVRARFRVYEIFADGSDRMVYLFYGRSDGHVLYGVKPPFNKYAPALLTGYMYIFHPRKKYRLKYQNHSEAYSNTAAGMPHPRTQQTGGLPYPPSQFNVVQENTVRESQWASQRPPNFPDGLGRIGIPTPRSNPQDGFNDNPVAGGMNFKFTVDSPKMLELTSTNLNESLPVEIFENDVWIGSMDPNQTTQYGPGNRYGRNKFGFHPFDELDSGYDTNHRKTVETNRIFFYPDNIYQIQTGNAKPGTCRLHDAVFNNTGSWSDGNENTERFRPDEDSRGILNT